MKKKIVIVLFTVLGINNLWADISIGVAEYQSIVYMNEFHYSIFNGIGIDCEYDFLATSIRPKVGIETAFYGIGMEVALKAGGLFDFYKSDINTFGIDMNYRVGANISFASIIHGLDCLLYYENNVSDTNSIYIKTGFIYRYNINYGGLNFIDIPIKVGLKFK